MARTFDGVDDVVTVGLGACGFTGDLTLAAIVKLLDDDATDRCIVGLGNSSNRPALQLHGTSRLITLRYGGNNLQQTLAATSADGWVLVAATKATGTTAPRFHKYVFSTGTYTAENDATTTATDATAPVTSNLIGNRSGTRLFEGDIGVVGAWNAVLTDAQIESLAFSLQAWFALQPKALWLLDQDAVGQAVLDLSGGGANQTAITGTAVATSSVPVFGYGHQILTAFQVAVAAVTGIPNLVTARR